MIDNIPSQALDSLFADDTYMRWHNNEFDLNIDITNTTYIIEKWFKSNGILLNRYKNMILKYSTNILKTDRKIENWQFIGP